MPPRVRGRRWLMDRLIDTLAPTTLVSERFNLLPEGTEAVELDTVLAAFARYPALPKLTSQEVLRRSIAEGAQRGLFGLASGASWDAGDAILRFREPVALDEIAFQPGVFLVRASAAESLLKARAEKAAAPRPDSGHGDTGVRDDREERQEEKKDVDDEDHQAGYDKLTVDAEAVPGGDVLKLVRSVMGQLNESGVSARVVLSVRAEGAITGDVRALIQEGVQQLGLREVRIEFG